MIYLFLNGSKIQLDSYWLPPKYVCHYCTLRVIVLFIAVAHGHCSWVGATCFPPLDACMTPSGIIKASSQRGGFHISPSSRPLEHVSEVHGVSFSNKNLTSASGEGLTKGNSNNSVLGVTWTVLTPQKRTSHACCCRFW